MKGSVTFFPSWSAKSLGTLSKAGLVLDGLVSWWWFRSDKEASFELGERPVVVGEATHREAILDFLPAECSS